MADDINNPHNDNEQDQDQEYRPPEKQSQEFGATPMSGGTESLASLLKNQKAIAAIGGIVFLYILMSLFSGGDDEDENIIVPQHEEPATMNYEDHSTPDIDATPVSIFASIDEMNDESSKASEDMERMKSQVASLNRQNIDLRNRMDKIDASLTSLAKTVERSSMQISALVKTQEKENKKENKEVLQEYRIRAVISGRAWLEDGHGNNVTVKVGDNLPTYGRITKIKPVEGIVETSSGRTISFSNNE